MKKKLLFCFLLVTHCFTNFVYCAIYTKDESPDLSIPDNDSNGVTSTLYVSGNYTISEINVYVDITHTYIGDLIVEIISPIGTNVRLHNRSGGSSDNITTWYDTNTSVDGPGGLSDFNGQSSQGNWQLKVSDNAGDDTGTLNLWKVEVNPPISYITVTSPNGGETWNSGQTKNIAWNYLSGSGSYVKIEYTDGTTWNTIEATTSNDGSYSWTIPYGINSTTCKIRVTSTSNSSYTDTSDSNFTIRTIQNDANSGGDAGNSTSSATYVSDDNYNGYLDFNDIDVYKFYVSANYEIKATISSSSTIKTVYLLNSNRTILASGNSASTFNLSYFTSKSDYYYLELQQLNSTGTSYSFTITLTPDYYCVIPYPNPFDISKGHTKITFAGSGVPYSKIRIYTLDGKLFTTLEENEGNNRINWNILNEDISPGIYLYGTDNPQEKNIGKFTIIR